MRPAICLGSTRLRRSGFEQKYLGLRDTNSAATDSLLSGFDKARVSGALPPLPGSYAMIPDAVVETFPHYGGKGCEAIGVTPEDVRQGVPNLIPRDLFAAVHAAGL